jgi:hypothetical protein
MKGRLRAALGMAVFASLLVGAASAMAASIIYGSAYKGSTGPATLYTISPTTGVATPIGPIGFSQVGSLDFCPNGVLYGIGMDASGKNNLLTINTATGAGTSVGLLGVNSTFQDMACRPSDGKLYAYSFGNIYTISTTTGVATFVGSVGDGFPDGNALAFSSANVLYKADQNSLWTINQSTGAGTVLLALTYPISGSRANGMKFDPPSGTLYASVVGGDSEVGVVNYFASINIATGVVTEIGPTVAGLDAIAIPAPAARAAIPALSPAALALLLCGLFLSGLFLLRRRQWSPNRSGGTGRFIASQFCQKAGYSTRAM